GRPWSWGRKNPTSGHSLMEPWAVAVYTLHTTHYTAFARATTGPGRTWPPFPAPLPACEPTDHTSCQPCLSVSRLGLQSKGIPERTALCKAQLVSPAHALCTFRKNWAAVQGPPLQPSGLLLPLATL